jgi:hypothetical protein
VYQIGKNRRAQDEEAKFLGRFVEIRSGRSTIS